VPTISQLTLIKRLVLIFSTSLVFAAQVLSLFRVSPHTHDFRLSQPTAGAFLFPPPSYHVQFVTRGCLMVSFPTCPYPDSPHFLHVFSAVYWSNLFVPVPTCFRESLLPIPPQFRHSNNRPKVRGPRISPVPSHLDPPCGFRNLLLWFFSSPPPIFIALLVCPAPKSYPDHTPPRNVSLTLLPAIPLALSLHKSSFTFMISSFSTRQET